MKLINRVLLLAFVAVFALTSCEDDDGPKFKTVTVDFEELTVPEAGYWNGSDESGSFSTSEFSFVNAYNATYGSWSGFAYANLNDVSTAGYGNQFSVYNADNADNTFILFNPMFQENGAIALPAGLEVDIESVKLCNSTYSALSMKEGDAFSKKFGGESGDDEDFYKVTIVGFDMDNNETGSVDFYLADYRFADNASDYIVSEWTDVDLSALGDVNRIEFRLASSDNGDWGMNTPAYVCIDDLQYEEELIYE